MPKHQNNDNIIHKLITIFWMNDRQSMMVEGNQPNSCQALEALHRQFFAEKS